MNKYDRKFIWHGMSTSDCPPELAKIMNTWFDLSEATGDQGSCVLGAGFLFTYRGEEYYMAACSPWQGSISWETHLGVVAAMLAEAGCTNINYDWGRMD